MTHPHEGDRIAQPETTPSTDARLPGLVSAGIHHRFGPVRKGVRILMHVPRAIARWRDTDSARRAAPPALANSVPKSGTHLLDQVLSALPRRRNYGRFLESMTASYIFQERSDESARRYVETLVSGELVRAHLHHSEEAERALERQRVAHFLIYRDPRDVVVSEAHYLRSMNRWHRMHPHFRALPTDEDAVSLAITGLPGPEPPLPYPDIGRRYARFTPWIGLPSVHALRFEDLVSSRQGDAIEAIVRHYARTCDDEIDVDAIARDARERVAPSRSHTFRKGASGGWREVLTDEQRESFKSLAGELLIELGYEDSLNW